MGVAKAIEQLYDAFQDMPRPSSLIHESWELQEGEVKRLTTSPLRELPPALMRSYLSDAVYNVGTWDDFRYFLPRLLELAPSREIDLESVSRRLRYASVQEFPMTNLQRRALRDFALSFWGELLPDDVPSAERSLTWGTLEPFGVTRDELLVIWKRHAAGALTLARLLISCGSLPPGWPRDEVLAWFQRAFFEESDCEAQRVLSTAVLILEAVPDR